jgi:hypothetical protein
LGRSGKVTGALDVGIWMFSFVIEPPPQAANPQTRPHKLLEQGEKRARKELDKTHFLSILSASIFISL